MIAQLRGFLAVVEEGSINRASARLRMSQPALSRQIQALEHEIGGPLLERLATGVRPTDLGHALARRMGPVVEEYQAALLKVRQLARGQRQELRIGYLGSSGPRFLTPALGRFRKAYPEIKLALRDLTPGEQIAALREGALDLALIGQEGASFGGEFYARTLATLGVQVALPAEHPLAGEEAIPLRSLMGEPFIGAPEGEVPGRNEWVAQLCRKAGFRPRFLQDADGIGDAFLLVAGEQAVAILPGYFIGEPPPGIAIRPVADAFAKWDYVALWQRGRTPPATKALLAALTEASASQPNPL